MSRRESMSVGELTFAGSDNKGVTIKQIRKYTATVDAAAAGAGGTVVSTSVTLTGVKAATDFVLAAIPPTTSAAELVVVSAVVSADNTVLMKTVGGVVDPASATYTFLIGRM